MLLALFTSPSRRGVMSFRNTPHLQALRRSPKSVIASDRITVVPSIGNTARFSSTKFSLDDYNSMKVSELRELLKIRGLAVSGIKAQLVDRLAVGKIDTRKVEKKPRRETKMKPMPTEDDDRLDDNVEDELAGLVGQLKPTEGGESNNEKKMGKKTKDHNELPNNLVFAKEDDKDDDGWDDDDVEDDEVDPNKTVGEPRSEPRSERQKRRKEKYPKGESKGNDSITFKEDFQGTRVFVQGLAKDATWKELKDHFKIIGSVVFASVSIDKKTGRSKQCGIVQFETPAMAEKAIHEMRDHPMNGEKLYVRKDVQESRDGSNSKKAGGRDERFGNNDRPDYKTALPTEWKRANDEAEDGGGDNWYNLKDDELKEIEDLIEKRDKQRRQNNYKMSDQIRNELKEEFGIHLDDRLKLWWTDTKHGGVPGAVSDIKGEGRWGKVKSWTQIPTNPESDSMVDSELVMGLLLKRDRARKKKDFDTADDLLQKAHGSPKGGLGLRIHDESRTWRIWTERAPPRKGETPAGYEKLTPDQMCLQIVTENEPDKVDEMVQLLKKFPGREWNIFKRLKDRYDSSE